MPEVFGLYHDTLLPPSNAERQTMDFWVNKGQLSSQANGQYNR